MLPNLRDGSNLCRPVGRLVEHGAGQAHEEERHYDPEADEADEGCVERDGRTEKVGGVVLTLPVGEGT